MRAAAKFARVLAATSPLSSILVGETSPGTSVTSDDDLNTWLAGTVGTEYHPSGSCAMLPLEQGGVVDTELIVYGTCELAALLTCRSVSEYRRSERACH
jgi:choline dehydrogenase